MGKNYLLAIDEGTTGTTATLADVSSGELQTIAQASEDFAQSFPQPGWVEHDLDAIWKAVGTTVAQAIQKAGASSIQAIGITNQRETVCFWDRQTLAALGPAIVWQDRRTSPLCEKLRAAGVEKELSSRTGLLLDPYFSGTKIAWAIENRPEVKEALKSGRLALGTIDSFLIARLTGGKTYATDATNASRTLLMDLRSCKWSSDLARAIGIAAPGLTEALPEIRPSWGDFGVTRGCSFLPDGIPIRGVIGDQQSALLGQACVQPGMAKCTYGTGAFLLTHTGSEPKMSRHRMLTTVAWMDGKGTTYALEGSAFVAGAAVQWLRDGLGLIRDSAEIESLAQQVASSEGVTFVPALTGLGAPYWNPEARGIFAGLTRGTTKAHLARAALEGIALQIADILRAMSRDLGAPLKSVNVDGGAAANNLLMQFQADMLGTELRRPTSLETTSTGALFAAGLGSGVWTSLDQLNRAWKAERIFSPKMAKSERDGHLALWARAIAQANLTQIPPQGSV